jgi:hypothetical protein
MPMKLVDPERMLDEGEKWERLYADIVVKRAK